MLDRLNESIKELIGDTTSVSKEEEDEDDEEEDMEKKETQKYNLDRRQLELLNVISSYVDFYDPDVDIQFDNRNKLVYVMHALNHTLKYDHFRFF